MAIEFSLINGSTLLVPDIKYMVQFTSGDLGISDKITKKYILKNLIQTSTPEELTIFCNVAGVDLKNSPESYFKDDKCRIKQSDFTLNKNKDMIGLKALEKSLLQCIFESQKPYMEVAKSVTKPLIITEDIIARLLSVGGASLKPKGNPKALGYQGSSNPLNSEISKLSSLISIKNKVSNNDVNQPSVSDKKILTDEINLKFGYEILSIEYSTGLYYKDINYTYEYIDLMDNRINENDLDTNTENVTGDDDDLKPEVVVFGIYNSKGISLTEENVPIWLKESGKWFGQASFLASSFNYKWIHPLFGIRLSMTQPKTPSTGWKQVLDSTGEPVVILKNNNDDLNYFKGYYLDYMSGILGTKDISQEDKNECIKEVFDRIDIQEQIDGLLLGGFLPTIRIKNIPLSIFNSINPVFPMKRLPYRPFKITFGGNDMWLDPENDYDLKIIKVDSSKEVQFYDKLGKPIEKSTLVSSIKNTTTFKMSSGEIFDIDIKIGGADKKTYSGVTEAYIDNADRLKPYTITLKLKTMPSFLKDGYIWTLENSNIAEIYLDNISNAFYYRETTYTIGKIDKSPTGISYLFDEPEGVYQIEYKDGIVIKIYNRKQVVPANWEDIYINWESILLNWEDVREQETYSSIGIPIPWQNKNFTYYWMEGQIRFKLYFDGKVLKVDKTYLGKQGELVNSKPKSLRLPNGYKVDFENNKLINFYAIENLNIRKYLTFNNLSKRDNIISSNNFNNITYTDSKISPSVVRIIDINNRFTKLIESDQITNDHLKISTRYSDGYYGSCDDEITQDIGQVYRFMKSSKDTESYYIIEGILSSTNTEENNRGDLNQPKSGRGYYRKPKGPISAITKFIRLTVEVFSSVIPTIIKFLNLIKNPASFIVKDVLFDKMQNFMFFNQAFMSQFKNLNNLSSSNRQSYVDNSELRNYVSVTNGQYKFLLEGSAIVNFLSLTFGASTNKLNPKLIYSNAKNNSNFPLKVDKLTDPTINIGLGEKLKVDNQIITTDGKVFSYEEVSIEYSTGVFKEDYKYDYIYVTQYVSDLINEAEELETDGSDDSLTQALAKYEEALKNDPNNKTIKDKIENLLTKISYQPILKFLLDLTTFPIKLVKGIVEYILNFFKSLTNPKKLITEIPKFLTFKWILDFFKSDSLLSLLGIKFDRQLFNSWVDNIDSYPDDYQFNLSKAISMPFIPTLFTANKQQLIYLKKSPMGLLESMLCLIENIINSVIDLIFAISGIKAILPAPYIKLCKDANSVSDMSPEDIMNILNGNYEPSLSSEFNFVYDIKLSDGRSITDLNRDELQNWIDENSSFEFELDF